VDLDPIMVLDLRRNQRILAGPGDAAPLFVAYGQARSVIGESHG
jgi:hypothetical protein